MCVCVCVCSCVARTCGVVDVVVAMLLRALSWRAPHGVLVCALRPSIPPFAGFGQAEVTQMMRDRLTSQLTSAVSGPLTDSIVASVTEVRGGAQCFVCGSRALCGCFVCVCVLRVGVLWLVRVFVSSDFDR